jgi:hypothetical protein
MVIPAAIRSLADEVDAVELLRSFLEKMENDDASVAAIRALGRIPEIRPLVWQQLKTGGPQAKSAALKVLRTEASEYDALRTYFYDLPKTDDALGAAFRKELFCVVAEGASTDWLLPYLGDPDGYVRAHAVEKLIDEPRAESSLRCRVFEAKSQQARRQLWRKFAHEPDIRAQLRVRAREDQREVRQAYFALHSADEARRGELRDYFREVKDDAHRVVELVEALARDPDARSLLLDQFNSSKDVRVLGTLLRVLESDNGLRTQALVFLRDARWVERFDFSAPDVLKDYFENFSDAKDIVLERVGKGDASPAYLAVTLPILRGYPPARDTLRGYSMHSNQNVRAAARAALAHDDSEVRDQLLKDLECPEKSERRTAAEALEDVEGAQEALARLTRDECKYVRRIAHGAVWRLGQTVPDGEAALANEEDQKVRRAILETLLLQSNEGARGVLRSVFAGERNGEMRARAAGGLRPAESAPALRDNEWGKSVINACNSEVSQLSAYLREPHALRRCDDPTLFDDVVVWICLKLVSTMSDMERAIDSEDQVFGEIAELNFAASVVRLRLAADAADLPRDRDLWPAANTIIAWNVAQYLVSDEPPTLLVACGNVAFFDLEYPKLEPGEMLLGPSFFGFRLRADDGVSCTPH